MIHKKLIEVEKRLSEIGIGKDSFNDHAKFKYRGIDNLLNTIGPILSQVGVVATPSVVKIERGSYTTKSNAKWQQVEVTITYTFFAEDGSSVSATVIGEGTDQQDKAVAKAMTAAYKAVMVQTFAIPIVGTAEDGDHTSEIPEDDSMVKLIDKNQVKALENELSIINLMDSGAAVDEGEFVRWLCGGSSFADVPADEFARAINAMATLKNKRRSVEGGAADGDAS